MIQHSKKLKVSLISALLVLGFVSRPAQADHNDHNSNLIAPLATFLVLGSLLRHNHGHHYKYSKRRYGHYGNYGNYGYNGHYGHSGRYGHKHNRRSRSYSYEGYNRKSRRNYQH